MHILMILVLAILFVVLLCRFPKPTLIATGVIITAAVLIYGTR